MIFMIATSFQIREVKLSQPIVNWVSFVPILFMSIILGCRYNVGVDYLNYYNYYYNLRHFSNESEFEYGYRLLNQICSELHFTHHVLFTATIFIQLVCFYHCINKDRKILPWILLFLFITGQLFHNLNVVRHAISASFFLCAVKYIIERKLFKYSIITSLACLFHNSSVILFPLYILGIKQKISFIDNRVYALLIFIVSFIMGDIVVSTFIEGIMNGLVLFGYKEYIYTVEGGNMEINSGYGMLLNKFLDYCTIWFSHYLYRDKIKGFVPFYRIFFVGIIFQNLFGLNLILNRIPFCLLSTRPIVLGYIFYYCWGKRIQWNYILSFIILCYFALFLQSIRTGGDGCSPFQFQF